ncbi:MAG: hypothetical protein ACYC1M_13415 [Armatimonadota bacterium]
MRILSVSRRLAAAVVVPLIATAVYAANIVPEAQLLGTKLMTPIRNVILRLGPPQFIGSAPCASDDIYGVLKQVLEQQGASATGAAASTMGGALSMPMMGTMPMSPTSSPSAAMSAGMLGTQAGPSLGGAMGGASSSSSKVDNMVEYDQATFYFNADDIVVRIASVKNTGKHPAAKTVRGVKQGDMFSKVIKTYGWPKRFAAEGQYFLLDYPDYGLRFGFKVNKVIYIESVIL